MNKEVTELVEWVAGKLFEWHCIGQGIPQEPFVNLGDYVKSSWVLYAKQILSVEGMIILTKRVMFGDI